MKRPKCPPYNLKIAMQSQNQTCRTTSSQPLHSANEKLPQSNTQNSQTLNQFYPQTPLKTTAPSSFPFHFTSQATTAIHSALLVSTNRESVREAELHSAAERKKRNRRIECFWFCPSVGVKPGRASGSRRSC